MKKLEKLTRKEFIKKTGVLTAGTMISPAVLKRHSAGNHSEKDPDRGDRVWERIQQLPSTPFGMPVCRNRECLRYQVRTGACPG